MAQLRSDSGSLWPKTTESSIIIKLCEMTCNDILMIRNYKIPWLFVSLSYLGSQEWIQSNTLRIKKLGRNFMYPCKCSTENKRKSNNSNLNEVATPFK